MLKRRIKSEFSVSTVTNLKIRQQCNTKHGVHDF